MKLELGILLFDMPAGGNAIQPFGDGLTSVEVYSPTGWTPLPPLPHAVFGATACVLNGRLYAMGGRHCDKLQVLEMSEENEFSWTVKAELPDERYQAASVVHEGKIWLIGGLTNWELNRSVLIYDIDADSWGTGRALPRAVKSQHATTHDGEVYVISTDGAWVYRNADWVRVQRPYSIPNLSAVESVLLG